MAYIAAGCAGFALCVLSDFFTEFKIFKRPAVFFGIGIFVIFAATAGILIFESGDIPISALLRVLSSVLAAAAFLLLIYSLFFAIPFKGTYGGEFQNKRSACDTGVYALCRHPGVIWFALFYLFLGIAAASRTMLIAAALFSMLNIIYIVIQDLFFFPRQFFNYGEYKDTTPFLIPTPNSIRRCISTLNARKESADEI